MNGVGASEWYSFFYVGAQMRHARPYSTDGVVEQKKKTLGSLVLYVYCILWCCLDERKNGRKRTRIWKRMNICLSCMAYDLYMYSNWTFYIMKMVSTWDICLSAVHPWLHISHVSFPYIVHVACRRWCSGFFTATTARHSRRTYSRSPSTRVRQSCSSVCEYS